MGRVTASPAYGCIKHCHPDLIAADLNSRPKDVCKRNQTDGPELLLCIELDSMALAVLFEKCLPGTGSTHTCVALLQRPELELRASLNFCYSWSPLVTNYCHHWIWKSPELKDFTIDESSLEIRLVRYSLQETTGITFVLLLNNWLYSMLCGLGMERELFFASFISFLCFFFLMAIFLLPKRLCIVWGWNIRRIAEKWGNLTA